MLTGKLKPGHVFAEGDHRADYVYYNDENINKINAFLDELRPFAESKRASVAQLVFRWSIKRPVISIALAGVPNSARMLVV